MVCGHTVNETAESINSYSYLSPPVNRQFPSAKEELSILTGLEVQKKKWILPLNAKVVKAMKTSDTSDKGLLWKSHQNPQRRDKCTYFSSWFSELKRVRRSHARACSSSSLLNLL